MTSLKLLNDVVKKKMDYRNKTFEDNEAAYFHVNDDDNVNDYRTHSITKNYKDKIIPQFGTANTLFEEECKTNAKIPQGQSCQCSSAVWCKYCLAGHPDWNVHVEEYDEILQLASTTFYDLQWNWGWSNAEKRRALRILLEGLWLLPVPFKLEAQPIVMAHALMTNSEPMIVLQDRHVIAIYATSSSAYYLFDNTIGCVKATTRKAAEMWLLWAATVNGEGPSPTGIGSTRKYHYHPTWIGVKCRNVYR